MENNIYEVAIVGAGFAGIGTAIKLKQAGKDNFLILERASEVGGTWRDNTYPGCGCDVQSHLYSFSFEPNPDWSRKFSKQPEILEYLKKCTQKYHLREHLKFNTEILSTIFDETKGYYKLSTKTGEQILARTVVFAIGGLNKSKLPNIKGLETFSGQVFHSSAWNHSISLQNKKVAVIGTGASAIQFVPEIAPIVEKLIVFQRTAPWIIPKPDKKMGNFTKNLFKKIPFFQFLYREFIFWMNELMGLAFLGSKPISKVATLMAKSHIKAQIKDENLREKVTPNYAFGCKRVLISDDYYPALQRDNVELNTDNIDYIVQNKIIDKQGKSHQVDVIIMGTGFLVSELPPKFVKENTISGLAGKNLFETWKSKGLESYKGLMVSGFPNLIYMVGPNSGLGHNSIIHIIESQISYIMSFLEALSQKPMPYYLNVNPEIQYRYNQTLQENFKGTVWEKGCGSWYVNDSEKNVTLWPKLNGAYRKETEAINSTDFIESM